MYANSRIYIPGLTSEETGADTVGAISVEVRSSGYDASISIVRLYPVDPLGMYFDEYVTEICPFW